MAANPDNQGPQSVLVIYAKVGSNSPLVSKEEAYSQVFSLTNDFYYKNSFGKMSLTGILVEPPNPLPANLCESYEVLGAAMRAVDPSVDFTRYSRIILYMPPTACFSGGDAGIGKLPVDTQDGKIRASIAKIASSNEYNVVHEFGHNVGLDHAGAGGEEYGDPYNIMGSGSGDLNSINKEEAGWLNVVTATQGDYLIKPIEESQSSPAIKLPKADGRYYYFTFKQPIDYDVGLPSAVYSGVFIHVPLPNQEGVKTELVNYNPSDRSSLLQVGQTVRLDNYDVTLKSASPNGALVNVRLTGQPPPSTNNPPVITSCTSPPSGTVSNLITVTYSASDPDNDAITASINWGDGSTSAGSLSSATHSYTSAGTFQISITVTDARGAAASRPCGSVAISPTTTPPTPNNDLPSPNHNILLGYYFADGRDGDFTSEVWSYTNLYVAAPAGHWATENKNWKNDFRNALQKASNNNKDILLSAGFDEGLVNSGDLEEKTLEQYYDYVLDAAAPYWSKVKFVEAGHEPVWDQAATEAKINTLKSKISLRGLAPKPIGITHSRKDILITNSIFASNLDWVAIEAYVDPPGDSISQKNVENLNNLLTQAKARIPSSKNIIMIMQAYDRNRGWTNINTLKELQVPVYMQSYDDPRVIAITMFAYGRAGGTRDYPELKDYHKKISEKVLKALPSVQPSIRLIFPNGGESASAGSSFTVTWTSQNMVPGQTITINLVSSSGVTNMGSSQNDGAETVTVPQVASGQYLVEVLATVNGAQVSDRSDGQISITGGTPPPQPIQSITIDSPNGGENFDVGSTQTITWTSQNLPQNAPMNLFFEGPLGKTNFASGTPNDGSEQVVVSLNPGQYRVGIETTFNGLPISDRSDGTITISSVTPQPYCGDLTCQNSESCSSCPKDCGECKPPPTKPYCTDTDNGKNYDIRGNVQTNSNSFTDCCIDDNNQCVISSASLAEGFCNSDLSIGYEVYRCPGACNDGRRIDQTTPPFMCNPSTQPYPHWSVKNGECLQSCGGLGGTYCEASDSCPSGTEIAGKSYDCGSCCKISGLPNPDLAPVLSISPSSIHRGEVVTLQIARGSHNSDAYISVQGIYDDQHLGITDSNGELRFDISEQYTSQWWPNTYTATVTINGLTSAPASVSVS